MVTATVFDNTFTAYLPVIFSLNVMLEAIVSLNWSHVQAACISLFLCIWPCAYALVFFHHHREGNCEHVYQMRGVPVHKMCMAANSEDRVIFWYFKTPFKHAFKVSLDQLTHISSKPSASNTMIYFNNISLHFSCSITDLVNQYPRGLLHQPCHADHIHY